MISLTSLGVSTLEIGWACPPIDLQPYEKVLALVLSFLYSFFFLNELMFLHLKKT